MTRKILRWSDSAVLWEGEAETVKDAIHAALKAGANLRGANLRDADLRDADLGDANLGDANLCGANLRYANLGDADLCSADLHSANLCGANLCGADLRSADLHSANLGDANLCGADLRSADLHSADLHSANLRDADLRDADLGGANIRGANLRGANLGDAGNLRLPTEETWEEYLAVTVPALLTAGGQPLESFAEHWQFHTWVNCPMAHAFKGSSLNDVPVLLRPRAVQFIQFFDANQIPWPLPTQTANVAE